ncbi:MAG: thiamine pyrophosphate-binding protein, partial [SAR202 cluster bacterium]|nr:thiamine pyrophosphate-binding protein [SAR202 cluster bacterium]
MSKMNGAQALVRQLASEGVDTVFGLPGVQIMAAFDALYEHRDRVRLIHFRHEQATTYAAFGYAAATGKPGVALVVPGPGALNATAGLGTAYAASKPVLLLSGQIPSDLLGKKQGHLHEVDDQLDVFRPITKWAHRVTRVGEIPEAVHEAFRHLKTGRPRPVELEIPPDTMLAEGDADIIEPEGYAKPSGDPAALDRAAKLLASSKHPLIIAGTGVVEADASPELLAVAEHLQAPILSSRGAKGTLPANHYLYAGAHYYVADHWQKLVSESDAVLAVGTRLLLSNVKFPPGRKIVHIDIDPEQIGRTHPVEVAIEADAKPALAALFDRLKRAEKPRPSRREEFERRKRDIRKSVRKLA